jgi:hypothetical protein
VRSHSAPPRLRQHLCAGFFGVGVQTTRPLGEDRFSIGGKLEAGFLDNFAISPQAILRYDVVDAPLYVQLGLGARMRLTGSDNRWGGNSTISPMGSLSFGFKVDRFNILVQLPGYPIIGLEFPL